MEIVKRITPEKAIEILQENGLKVTGEQAQKILDFLYKLIHAALNQSIEHENS